MGCGASRVAPRCSARPALRSREAADLTEPLVAAHFHGRGRLAAAGAADDLTTVAGADIRLLSARKLVAYIDGGGRLEIRQTLEAAGKDIFLDRETARGPLARARDEGCEGHVRRFNIRACTFSGVVDVAALRVGARRRPRPGGRAARAAPPRAGVVDVRARAAEDWATRQQASRNGANRDARMIPRCRRRTSASSSTS